MNIGISLKSNVSVLHPRQKLSCKCKIIVFDLGTFVLQLLDKICLGCNTETNVFKLKTVIFSEIENDSQHLK